MSTDFDLKHLERKAFRSTYQDGLLDIYMGTVVAAMGIFIFRPESGYTPFNIILMILIMLVGQGLYQAGKKLITQPRMGQVRFGPIRQKKNKTLAMILGIVVFVQVGVVGLTTLGWLNPQVGAKLFGSLGIDNIERLVVAGLGSLFVGPSMLVMAYMTDFPRGYYIAVLMALAVFLMILTNQPVYPVVIGAFIILPGVVIFIDFLKKYPLPREDRTNG